MKANLFKSRDLSKLGKIFLFAVLLSNMAFSQNAGFGSLASDRTEPIEFTSDRLIFNQGENLAELFDEVKIIQGKTVLSADYVKAIYSKTNKLEKVFAERNIELKSEIIIVTNGLNHFYFKLDKNKNQYIQEKDLTFYNK